MLAGIGLYALLPSVDDVFSGMRAVRTADWRWLGAAPAASALSYVAAAVVLPRAAGRRLRPPLRAGLAAFAGVLRHLRQAGTLPAGAVGVTSSYVTASAAAFGLELGLSLPEVATAYHAGAALASACRRRPAWALRRQRWPRPWWRSAPRSAQPSPRCSPCLVTFWLPILPGLLALRAHGAV